ncbi:hypothetical protein CROQUDRAFT_371622 [Cronartium quercuum f. sp. fusiforme G11]|uniref:Uncharacterized protein n=1 Tax=Cronartium quercuum f. sp. fusiforme G11 TaxID=708437 RepID=A0A9P6TEJ4_9BASI|nr:hypothetical protein CROQUDRAFT_371622 [Cronartium quercuum f. sp. fusiforme G11]
MPTSLLTLIIPKHAVSLASPPWETNQVTLTVWHRQQKLLRQPCPSNFCWRCGSCLFKKSTLPSARCTKGTCVCLLMSNHLTNM